MTLKRLLKYPALLPFLVILLLSSCHDDIKRELDQLEAELARVEQQNRLLEFNNKILAFKNRIAQANIDEELVKMLTPGVIKWENGAEYQFPDSLILQHEIFNEEWKMEFLLADSTILQVPYQSNFLEIPEDVIEINPYGVAPLTATIVLNTPVKGVFEIVVRGQDGPESDFTMPQSNPGKAHHLEVMALYPEYDNEVEVRFLSLDGVERVSKSITVGTGALPEGMPDLSIVKNDESPEPNTLILLNYRPTNIPFMIDVWGKIRWYSMGFSTQKKYGLQRLSNGNLMYGVSGAGQGRIVEYSLMGELINQLDVFPKYENIHHDVFEMKNGNLLVTVDKVGEDTIEDHILELDRQSGQVLTEWDLRKILPTDRFEYLELKGGLDWFHCNAVIEDISDQSIIVSGRAQGVVKIGWDMQLKWILAPHVGWEVPFDAYLLTPDMNGNFDWAWGQHAPELLSNGNLLLFDNGYGRDFGNAVTNYSRAVEYEIRPSLDQIGGSIKQVWEYGKERGEEMYASFISDVDYVSTRDSRFIVAGSIGFNHQYISYDNSIWESNIDTPETRIIEVNASGKVLFELLLHNDLHAGSTYRAEKLFFEY